MIFRGLANLIRTIRTELLVELETHPQALRQGAAAAVAVAAVAAVMPAISHRAAEQRADAEWAARAEAFQLALAATEADTATLTKASLDAVSPAARVTLAVAHADEGLRARVEGATLDDRFQDRHATTVAVALRDQAALIGLSAFQPATLRAASEHARDLNCLAQAIYYEARGESELGQLAVAEVVVNRARSRHFPGKFCDVIYEGSWRSTGCQFTFTCDGSLRNKPRGIAWAQARDIAAQVMMGVNRPVTHDATHYHTTEVAPIWSASLVETTRIGAHIFYRFPSRREREAMRAAPVTPESVDEVIAVGAPPQVGQAVETASAVVAIDHAT